MTGDPRFVSERFPRASAYHPDWVMAGVSGGANALWLTEWLASAMDLRPGMRVLDLGCGRASSSIFLRREFGVQVWATDLWFSASENLQRIRDAGVDDGVFPIHADARSLPFAAGFFDAIVSIDSFFYYGTDDLYLGTPRPPPQTGRPDRHRRGRPDPRDRRPGSRSPPGLVDARSLVPPFSRLVAAALGADRHRGCRARRYHARRLAIVAGLASDDLSGQPRRDRGDRGRSRRVPRLRPRRRPSQPSRTPPADRLLRHRVYKTTLIARRWAPGLTSPGHNFGKIPEKFEGASKSFLYSRV